MAERPLYIDGNDFRRLETNGLLDTRGLIIDMANISGAQIDAGHWVFFEESTGSLQLATRLDTHNAAQPLGVTLEDIPDLSTGPVQTAGVVDLPDATWDSITGGVGLISGRDYWLLSNGHMQDGLPTGGWLSQLGKAIGTTKFRINTQLVVSQV